MTYNKEKSVRHTVAGRFCLYIAAALALGSCHESQAPTRLYGEAQGTYYSISYFDPQHRDLQSQVDSLLDAFDQSVSLWVDSSLLRRINANLTDTLDPILTDMLGKSKQISHYTSGAFDVRVGRLVQAWGFSFKTREEPDSAALAALLTAARADVTVDNGRIVKGNPDTELDFNAIAQGYSVDMLAAMFDSLGVADYLIDVGGEVIARGGKPDGSPWRVGIERPAEDRNSAPEVHTAIALRDRSVVTSGSYRKYYEKDGMRFSHTIDPATGRPVSHTLLSVSVIEDEAWLADAMATAYMVMGLDRARDFIETHPAGPGTDAVYFIYDDGGTLKEYATPGFTKIQQQ